MSPSPFLTLRNGQCARVEQIPSVSPAAFRDAVIGETRCGARISSFFGMPAAGPAVVRLVAVLARDAEGILAVLSADVDGAAYPALTPDCPQAHWFEREIREQWGVEPVGHPWLKPIRFQPPCPAAGMAAPPPRIGVADFYRLEGSEAHEVAVGPVHAGVVEPGHFRFQCHGEHVYHLEISLGYQHRGVERAAIGGPGKRTIHYMETLAGDTTIGHATAYAGAVEALAGSSSPARGQVLRGIALELERLANHTGDLGALAGDIGYLPTASFCGRLRGDWLNMTALLCGNRFGRGLVRPGGAGFDTDGARTADLLARLDRARRDVEIAVNLLWESPSVLARFEETGAIGMAVCADLGLVGPPARACGVGRDVRYDFPSGIYAMTQIPVSTWHTGDVFARAYVRWLEIQRSVDFVRAQLRSLPGGACRVPPGPLAPERLVVSMVEGWRGEICHTAITDSEGRFRVYKVVDPSFHNWIGLAMAMRGQQISDFPLCNKSFNLSYCGHDL